MRRRLRFHGIWRASRIRRLVLGAGGGLLGIGVVGAALPPEEAVALLRQEGVEFSDPALRDTILESLARAVDSQARILSAEEAGWVGRQRQGLGEGSSASARASDIPESDPPPARPAVRPVEYWPREVAYLKVESFYPGSAERFRSVWAELSTARVYGVILDLRGAAGAEGEAASVCAAGLGVTSEWAAVENRAGEEIRRLRVEVPALLPHPLMMLVDGQTREMAELLAAAGRGRPRVMVVGIPTRGEAYLRDLIPLPEGRFLDFARYRLRLLGGADYQGRGVTPDIDVAYARWTGDESVSSADGSDARGRKETADRAADAQLDERIGTDPILRRAADLLLGLKALEQGRHESSDPNPR